MADDNKKMEGNKKAIEQIIDMVSAIRPEEVDEEIKANLEKLHSLVRAVQVPSVGSRKWAPMINSEPGKESAEKVPSVTKKEEPKKKEEKKKEAQEATEPIDPKEAARALKEKKNQFAINRLVFMLLDIDPGSLTQKMIDDIKRMYELLVDIHSRQSGPKENNKKDSK